MAVLEDDVCDILQKARSGHGWSMAELVSRSGLSAADLEAFERGRRAPTAAELRALSIALALDAERLQAIAAGAWRPQPHPERLMPPVIPLTGSYGGYPVHGYLCFDPGSRAAALIDTAYQPELALAALERHGLKLDQILLTHGHADHLGGLDRLRAETGARVNLHPLERGLYQQHIRREPERWVEDGAEIAVGALRFTVLATPGHTPGGVSYQVGSGLFVGDALFAGSTGRSMSPAGYRMLLDGLRARVLTLREETRIYPGHGPATTVGEERAHNPFFP